MDADHTTLNLALTSKAEKWLCWNSARFYCQGDKIGAMLAHRLTPKSRTFAVPKIRIQGGTLSQNPQHIMREFHSFYKKLYSSGTYPQQSVLDQFLDNIQISKLEDHLRMKLEAPIAAEEVCDI